MGLDVGDQRPYALGEGLPGNPELSFYGADIRDSLRSLLEDREMLPAKPAAKRIGRVQGKPALPLQCPLDGTPYLALLKRIGFASVKTGVSRRAHDAVPRMGEKVHSRVVQRIKRERGWLLRWRCRSVFR